MSNQRTTTCSEYKSAPSAQSAKVASTSSAPAIVDRSPEHLSIEAESRIPETRGSIHWGNGFPLVSGPANGVTISPMR
jgi:hypothetical protein